MTDPFVTVASAVIPLPLDNVDTDQIIPARFLKTTERDGLRDALFHDWRFSADGSLREPRFVLDEPGMGGRQILLAGENFGCGSSREHAAWALAANGIRAVLSTRFADIFRNNALKNGLVPITVSAADHARVSALVADEPEAEIAVDLAAQEVRLPDGTSIAFEVDPFARRMLLEGTDEIGWMVARTAAIDAHEKGHRPRYDTRVGQTA